MQSFQPHCNFKADLCADISECLHAAPSLVLSLLVRALRGALMQLSLRSVQGQTIQDTSVEVEFSIKQFQSQTLFQHNCPAPAWEKIADC